MTQFAIPPWARAAGKPVNLSQSPHWGTQDAGIGGYSMGNGNGMGYYRPLEQFAGAAIDPVGGTYSRPDVAGAENWLTSSGQQMMEASNGQQGLRWLQDAQGNITAEPETVDFNDGNAAFNFAGALGLLAGGYMAMGGGAGAGGAAVGTGAAEGSLALTGLEATSPLISSSVPAFNGAAVGMTAGETAALAGGGLGTAGATGAGGAAPAGLSGAFGSAPTTATGFYTPSFTGAASTGGPSLMQQGLQLGAGLLSTKMQGDAAKDAAAIQAGAANQGAQTMRDVYQQVLQQLQPYTQAGVGALQGQQNLIGLGGNQAQKDAIAQIQAGPEFQAMTQQGEAAILANASATGGLRGGNVQAALGQFRPQVLAQLINQQYARLGGLSSLGQNSAAGVGNAAVSTGSATAGLQQQAGAAQAGGALAQGRTNAGYFNNISEALGLYGGLTGGW